MYMASSHSSPHIQAEAAKTKTKVLLIISNQIKTNSPFLLYISTGDAGLLNQVLGGSLEGKKEKVKTHPEAWVVKTGHNEKMSTHQNSYFFQ
jgi:hypothetical protein